MKAYQITAILVFSLSTSQVHATSNPSTTDTITVSAPKESSWINLQGTWEHLAHIGKMAWPANWFKDKHKADSDSCLVLTTASEERSREELPRFYNSMHLELKQQKVSHNLRISWDKKKKPEQLAIFNLSGEKVLDFKLAYAGLGELEVPVYQLLPGTYFVKVTAGSEAATLAFVKK